MGQTLEKLPRKAKKARQKIHCANYGDLPGELLPALDRYAEQLAAGDPLGRTVTRTDAIRVLVADALKRAGIE